MKRHAKPISARSFPEASRFSAGIAGSIEAAEGPLPRYEQRHHLSGRCAPKVTINPDPLFLSLAVLVLLVWPRDQSKQAQYAATYGLGLLDMAGRASTKEFGETMIAGLAASIGMRLSPTPDLVSFMRVLAPGMRKAGEIFIDAAGGYNSAASAAGSTALNSEVLSAVDGKARNAGLVLLNVLKLGRHPAYSQSLNSACAVVTGAPLTEGGLRVNAGELLRYHWKKHQARVALWAAAIAGVEYFSGKSFNAATFPSEFRVLLGKCERVLLVLRWAMSIRDTATTTASGRAKTGAAWLPDHAAIDLRVTGLSPETPILRDLSKRALVHAVPARLPTKAIGKPS